MFTNYYQQKISFGSYSFNSQGTFHGLFHMEATATVLRGAEAKTNFVSLLKIDDKKVRVIKGGEIK